MSLLDTVRRSIFVLFNSMPIVLMTVNAVLGAGLVNAGMLWIFAGQVILFVINGVIRLFFGKFSEVDYTDTEVIVPSESMQKISVFPSMWIVQVSYFFMFVWFNARDVYNADPVDTGSDYTVKVNNRKSRTMMIMIFSLSFLFLLVGCRVLIGSNKAKNSLLGILSIGIGGLWAWAWYEVGNQPNIRVQKMDIFGISQQMMIVPTTDLATMCQAV